MHLRAPRPSCPCRGSDSLLTVFAWYRTLDGQGSAAAEILARHAAASAAEPGCVRFDVHRGTDDQDTFVLHEQYEDEDAFQRRRDTEHFRRNVEEDLVPEPGGA